MAAKYVIEQNQADEMAVTVIKRVDPDVEQVTIFSFDPFASLPHIYQIFDKARKHASCLSRFWQRLVIFAESEVMVACPYYVQVLASAGHVCLYHMSLDSQEWVRCRLKRPRPPSNCPVLLQSLLSILYPAACLSRPSPLSRPSAKLPRSQ